MRRREAPTERDRFWLDHEAAVASSELTTKAYAAEHGLSLHAFYQARKRLRALGLLTTGVPRRSPKTVAKTTARPMTFSKIAVGLSRPCSGEFRLSLPGGAVLEWSGEKLPPAVVDLVERLTSPR